MSLSRIVPFILPALALPFAAFAQPADNAPVTKDQIPALVKEAIMNEPEIIMEAVQRLREKQKAEADKKTAEAIAANKEAVYNDPSSPAIGNLKDPDVTIVEFFDYHCGYCKHVLPVISQIVKDDPKVKVVFKEFPILSEDSVKAARAAIAVNRIAPEKYFAFHSGLMEHKGEYSEKALTDIAKKSDVDAAAMMKEMAKEEVTAALDKSRKLGELLGVRGTPAIIMNDHFLPGAVSIEDLKKMIANVRAGKKPDYVAPDAKKEEKK